MEAIQQPWDDGNRGEVLCCQGVISGTSAPCHTSPLMYCRREVCWAGWGWGQRGEASVPLTDLFFQMIDSNDISGEKIRMKETVEGEWPLGRRDTGLGTGWLVLPLSWEPHGFASSAIW